MAEAVQYAQANGAWNAEPTTLTATFASAVTAGNLIVVQVAWRPDLTTETPAMSGFQRLTTVEGWNTSIDVFARVAQAGDDTGVTVTFAADGTRMAMIAAEYAGTWPDLTIASSYDVDESYLNSTMTATGASLTTTGTALLIASLATRGNNGDGVAVSSPFAIDVANTAMGPNTGEVRTYLGDVAGASGTYNGNWTWTTATTAQAALVAVYEDAGTAQLDTPVVTVDATTNPSSAIAEDGTADVSWPAITGAGSYRVELASGLNATTGFTVVEESHATTSIQLTGLGEGDRTVGVTAKP